jgi:hypothetical protein
MIRHIPEEFSTELIDRSPFVSMGNTTPPRDPDEEDEKDEEEEDRGWNRARTLGLAAPGTIDGGVVKSAALSTFNPQRRRNRANSSARPRRDRNAGDSGSSSPRANAGVCHAYLAIHRARRA